MTYLPHYWEWIHLFQAFDTLSQSQLQDALRMAYIPHHWERTHLMNYKWMNELQITVKNIGKHKSFPNAEFLKIFGVKRNADNPLNMGKVNFRFTWKLWEYKNISKLRNSWIFGMKQKSAQTLRKCEWFSHHGKKCGNTKNIPRFWASWNILGETKIYAIFKSWKIYILVLWESSNYFQTMDSLQYFRLSRNTCKPQNMGIVNSHFKWKNKKIQSSFLNILHGTEMHT